MTPSLHGRTFFRTGALASLLAAALAPAIAQDVPTSPELDGNSTKENWISLSGGAFISVDGNEGSFQRRHQHEGAGFVGADSFRYVHSLESDRTLRIDGKAVVGDGEYALRAVLRDENNGWYLDAGFRESRVFYVGSGGYSPGGLWIQPHDDQLAIDRGEFWLEAGYEREAWTFKVRGSRRYREGEKDSTMWGESGLAGVGTANRKIVPTLLDIDETRTSLALDLGYESEKMEAGAGLRFENIEIDNTAYSVRNPGQANPSGSGERWQRTETGSDSDLFSGHVFSVVSVSDRLTLSGAASTTTIDTTLEGNRIFGATPDAPYVANFPRTSTGHGYNDLHGDTQWDQWVLVGNAVYIPAKNWTVNGGLRYENQTQDSFSEYIETAGPANNPLEEPFEQEGEREFDEFLATLEANYNGINNWVFTPFVEYAAGEGNLVEHQLEGHAPAATVVIDRDTDYDRDYLKYGLTARWYPSKMFNTAVGAYRKERNNAYDAVADNTPPVGGNRYPAFIDDQDFTTNDLYVKATLRPTTGLSLTARWDRQRNVIETTEQGLAGSVRADQDVDIVSATLTWVATANISAQIGINRVGDGMETQTIDAVSPAAPTVGRFQSDYETLNAVVMIAIDEASDVQFDYYSFDADNYAGMPSLSLPYGLEAKETVVGTTYTRKLSADRILSLRLVYSDYEEPSSGGHLDYDSFMLYGRYQMRF